MNRRRAAVLLEAQLQYYRNMNKLANAMRTRVNELLRLAEKQNTPRSHRISRNRFRLVRVRRVKTKMAK
ncbi:hypothetical protein EBT25_05515 [bacterium]|nr:hypothetical protein [bacterium]